MKKSFQLFFATTVILSLSSSAWAGQALIINTDGDPIVWDASAASPISVHPESGACGRFSNAQMLASIEENLEEWTSLTTVDLAIDVVAGEIDGVDGCNYTDYLVGVVGNTDAQNSANVNDDLNPILFDNDGELVDEATGESNGRYSILGFANPDGFSVSPTDSSLYLNIVDGQALFNCYCLDDGDGNPAHDDCNDVPVVFTDDDLVFTQIHEMGHFLNLDHTQINLSVYTDSTDDNESTLPTMFPVSADAENQKTPNEDDIMAMSALYPSSSFFSAGSSASTYCKVTGTLLDRFGEEMRCADVQAIASDDLNNVSFTSGAYAPATDNNGDGDYSDVGECDGDCGDFTLYLKPDTDYTLKSASIYVSFTGGSGMGPCVDAQPTACTATIITGCTDDSTSTSCPTKGCVADETLTTNAASSNIAAVIAAQCTAGATINLGDINSASVSKTAAATETLIKGRGRTRTLIDELDQEPKFLEAITPMQAATLCEESGGSSTSSSSSSSCSLNAGAPPITSASSVLFLLVGMVLLLFKRRLG